MKAQIKVKPTRIRVPIKGNGLMLFMEAASKRSSGFVGKVTALDEHFDIQVKCSIDEALSIKNYINLNL